jgi:hypothetical protein
MAAFRASAISAGQLAGMGTGSIVGVVRDASHASMPDVDVTISGRALMAPRKIVTRADGEYRFALLPPGDYVLTFAARGFDSLTRETHVDLASTLTIDVMLSIAPSRDAIEVRGSLDRYSAAVSQSFNARQLASVPGSRSLAGLFSITQALTLQYSEVGGGAGIVSGDYGAYGRNNSPRHTIEGIVVTGLFGAGFTPDYGSLEEVSVVTAAPGAEWPTSGVHTDLVTKSGSNQYRGSIYVAGEDRRVQSSNVDADQIRRGVPSGGSLRPTQINQLWRNAEVNADIGGFVKRNRLWWYSSFRRQDVAARLVNFRAEPYDTRLTNYSGKATFRLFPNQSLVVYGQRGVNLQPTRLDAFTIESAINETSDSTVKQRNASRLWKVEWNASVRNSLVIEVRAGQFGWDQQWTPRSAAPRFEDLETLVVRGGNRAWESNARRNQLTGTVSYFEQNRTGRHYLRFGGEAIRFVVQDALLSGFPDDVLQVLRNGHASSVYLFETPSVAEAGVRSYSAYASDTWQIRNRVTVTAGARFDRYRLFLPAQQHAPDGVAGQQFAAVQNLADWNSVTPRFSAVFDIRGDGGTLAKFAIGRYRVAPNASLAFNSNPNASYWWRQYDWADPDQSGVFEPGEAGLRRRLRGGVAMESMDPGLKLPTLDEAGTWIEHTIAGDVALRTGLVWRLERSQFVRQNINQPFEAFAVPVQILDRGPDGVAGTEDDGPFWTAYDLSPDYVGQPVVNVVRNVPRSSSEYLTWEIAATRQTRGRWSFSAGFSRTWNGDQASGYSGQTLRNNVYALTPNDLLNAGDDGRYEFSSWTAKAYAIFEAPKGVHITPVLRYQSGQPFGRTETTEPGQLSYGTVTLLMEPVGTRQLDDTAIVDLRMEKTMRVKQRRVALFVDVFNCFNTNAEQNVIWTSGPSFMRPLTIVPPRIVRAGATFDW